MNAELGLPDLPPAPPLQDSVQVTAGPPLIKQEVTSPPVTSLGSQPQVQLSSSDPLPAPRPLENPAPHQHPWFQPAPPPPQSSSQLPANARYSAVHGGLKSEPGFGPQLPPGGAWIPPSPPVRSSHLPESNYYGPCPTIRNFSYRDPTEFARLKLSLEHLLPPDASEPFKYQVLVDHLQLEEARLIADTYLNSPTPFSDTMAALNDKFGQPHQIALRRIAAVLDSPDIRRGDVAAFERFAPQVQSLVGMLRTLGSEGEAELQCGSHVARLLSKLPPEQCYKPVGVVEV